MDLIVVESPTKAKTLGKFLGSGFQVAASFGHIRDLPTSKIGIDTEHDFEPVYVQTDKQKERLKEIKSLSKEAKTLYLATDPDREGEAISWHVAELLKHKNTKRIEFHEITKTAIDHALQSPKEIDMQLVDAQQARRILDRLVGYKLSPILWKKVRRGLSAGRVQSVTVRLIADREREIEAHKAVEYWEIFVETEKFKIKLTEENAKKINIENTEQAQKVEQELKSAIYVVESVEKKEFSRTPPAPFTTSTLQQAAANKLGWSAKKAMQVAQSLYEEGLITYHRTDSTNIAAEALMSAKEYIEKTFGKVFGLEIPRLYKTKDKVAQEAHEAIRPTDVSIEITNKKFDNHEQERMYDLIWKRFLATQMAETTGESVRIKVGAGVYGLEAKGETIKFSGWSKLYERINDEEEVDDKVLIPDSEVGAILRFVDLKSEQKFTQPPARYNDASLIKTLEEMGIGRPSTYAPTISTIQDRQYVEKVEKRFKPTAIGIAVNDFLVTNFAEIVDYQFTAKMEDDLDEIANGGKKWKQVLTDFYGPFSKKLGTMEEVARVKIEVEATGDKCPTCSEGDVVIRTGKFGKFLSCSRYPECSYKANFQNRTGIRCPKCTTGDVIARKTKTGRTFFGCSNYPNCDFASWTKPVVATETSENAPSQHQPSAQ